MQQIKIKELRTIIIVQWDPMEEGYMVYLLQSISHELVGALIPSAESRQVMSEFSAGTS